MGCCVNDLVMVFHKITFCAKNDVVWVVAPA